MSEQAQSDIQKYGYNPKDMPDCFLPDNFDEVFQRIGIHGTRPRRDKKTGEPKPPHHVEGGVTEEEYVQLVVSVMTAPDAIVSLINAGVSPGFLEAKLTDRIGFSCCQKILRTANKIQLCFL